jgi:hypothetical protein
MVMIASDRAMFQMPFKAEKKGRIIGVIFPKSCQFGLPPVVVPLFKLELSPFLEFV